MDPNLRGSLNTIVTPLDMKKMTWSCLDRNQPPAGMDLERARHSEMHHERAAGRQLCDQVLAAEPQRADGRAFQAAREARWQQRA